MATLCPPEVPRKGQSRKCEQKGGSWVHPWTPQADLKSIKINRNFKVSLCVGVGMRFLYPSCRQRGAGYAQTIVNGMVFKQFNVLEIWCFFVFLGLFCASFLLILGVLGRHFGSPKVNANFDRKTGMDLNPGIPANPGKSRDGGSRSPKNYQQDPPWTARPPEARGSPKDPHGHQNDIKIDPETNKMTPKTTPRLTTQLHNKLKSTGRG